MHELLHAYFDDELDASQRTAFEDHLGHCPDCARELAAQRELRSALQHEDLRYLLSPELAARVRASLPQPNQLSARPRRRLASMSAAAILFGTALSIAGLALILQAPSAEERLAQEATANHARALQAGHLLDIASTDRHRVKPWFQPRVDFAPPVVDLVEQGFPLAGGRLDFLDGRTVAALVYHRRDHVINLFIWPAKSESESAIRTTSHRGYGVVYWSKFGLNFWVVSDLNVPDLREFARLLRDEPP